MRRAKSEAIVAFFSLFPAGVKVEHRGRHVVDFLKDVGFQRPRPGSLDYLMSRGFPEPCACDICQPREAPGWSQTPKGANAYLGLGWESFQQWREVVF